MHFFFFTSSVVGTILQSEVFYVPNLTVVPDNEYIQTNEMTKETQPDVDVFTGE